MDRLESIQFWVDRYRSRQRDRFVKHLDAKLPSWKFFGSQAEYDLESLIENVQLLIEELETEQQTPKKKFWNRKK